MDVRGSGTGVNVGGTNARVSTLEPGMGLASQPPATSMVKAIIQKSGAVDLVTVDSSSATAEK
jgi:hypothetical protein